MEFPEDGFIPKSGENGLQYDFEFIFMIRYYIL